MTSNDIPAMYAAAIERNGHCGNSECVGGAFPDKHGEPEMCRWCQTMTGEYANPEARARLADAAGACMASTDGNEDDAVGLRWSKTDEGTTWACTDDCSVDWSVINLWQFHGRLAPLVSLDAAASVPMPEGYDWEKVNPVGHKCKCIYVTFQDGTPYGQTLKTFPYTDPRDRACAECAARVYANLKAKDNGHE